MTPKTRLLRTSSIMQAGLGDDAVALMSVGKSSIFGLEGPASKIWDLLAVEQTFGSLVDALVEQYDIDRASCAADVTAFLSELEKNNLVQVFPPGP